MFFLYQEASKIPNMTGLDLSLFYKKNEFTVLASITYIFKSMFFIQKFPRSVFYCSSNNESFKILNFFNFFFEEIIKKIIIKISKYYKFD